MHSLKQVLKQEKTRIKSNLVTQSNCLIEASYELGLPEKRVILCLLSKVDPRKPLPTVFNLDANEYAHFTGAELNHAYEELKKGVKGLQKTPITIYDKNADDGTDISWMDYVSYLKKKEARIEAKFGETVRPYISLLAKQFTSIPIDSIAKFRSFYAIRLFELLMQYKIKKGRTITVEQYRKILNITSQQYPRFNDFKRRVIEPSVKEINAKSYYHVTWAPIKKGRTITSLQFTFQEQKQVDMFKDMQAH